MVFMVFIEQILETKGIAGNILECLEKVSSAYMMHHKQVFYHDGLYSNDHIWKNSISYLISNSFLFHLIITYCGIYKTILMALFLKHRKKWKLPSLKSFYTKSKDFYMNSICY